MGVSVGLDRILAQNVQSSQISTSHRVQHLAHMPAVLRRYRHPPRSFESGTGDVVVFYVLKAGQAIRYGTHVAPALDIVLPSQGIQARAVAADMATKQGKVDQGEHVV